MGNQSKPNPHRQRSSSRLRGIAVLLSAMASDIEGLLEDLPVDLVGVIRTLVRGPIVHTVDEIADYPDA